MGVWQAQCWYRGGHAEHLLFIQLMIMSACVFVGMFRWFFLQQSSPGGCLGDSLTR